MYIVQAIVHDTGSNCLPSPSKVRRHIRLSPLPLARAGLRRPGTRPAPLDSPGPAKAGGDGGSVEYGEPSFTVILASNKTAQIAEHPERALR
eukprot:SM000065S20220  [mRNA]  locus=s65:370841:372323:- [translate_table: standard]